ncbi:SpoIIE family protein phosphatase [Actinomadura gamaensis]|uniref:SpoIIE family protein phosphatase n=1 Tax=Actinomadura gamaensis TaxID=1763541 RepID=A0ABV9TW97_9ACTN
MTETGAMPMGAELSGVRDGARERAVLSEARVVLADRLGCPSGEALQHLIWLARDLDLELDEAAALVVEGDRAVTETADAPVDHVGRGAVVAEAPPEAEPVAQELLARVADADTAQDAVVLASLPDDPGARAILDASLTSAAHLVPVRDADGRVVDFLYARLNDSADDLFERAPHELVGRRLLRSEPGAALSGLFAAYVRVLETGEPFARGPFLYTSAQDGVTRGSRMTVRCVPVQTGVVVSWRYLRGEDRMRWRLERAERLVAIGFGEWDLATGRITGSPQMAANYGLDPSTGSLVPEELGEVIHREDRELISEGLRTLFARREPVEVEHRVVLPSGRQRHLWVFAEPVLDASGRPVTINLVSQDITRRRGVERALARTRREILRQQALTAQERRVAATLRRAILPDPESGGVRRLPGVTVAVRSLAAESEARIGGDWFATRSLPDGRALMAVGDAAGHGLPAAAAMARMRNGLLGMAYTGRSPGRLVGWLNDLVCDLEPASTGTAVVAHFEPQSRYLEWASAGHPPPVLLRDGKAGPLSVDAEPLLGAAPEFEYGTNSTLLEPGDVVLFYTDGLVERRDADLEDGIARLSELLAECPDPEPDAVLDRVLERIGHDRSADDTTLFAFRVV